MASISTIFGPTLTPKISKFLRASRKFPRGRKRRKTFAKSSKKLSRVPFRAKKQNRNCRMDVCKKLPYNFYNKAVRLSMLLVRTKQNVADFNRNCSFTKQNVTQRERNAAKRSGFTKRLLNCMRKRNTT